jgi:hypothetical protein
MRCVWRVITMALLLVYMKGKTLDARTNGFMSNSECTWDLGPFSMPTEIRVVLRRSCSVAANLKKKIEN